MPATTAGARTGSAAPFPDEQQTTMSIEAKQRLAPMYWPHLCFISRNRSQLSCLVSSALVADVVTVGATH